LVISYIKILFAGLDMKKFIIILLLLITWTSITFAQFIRIWGNPADEYTVALNAFFLPSGIYIYSLQVGSIYLSKQMILNR